MKAIPIKTSFNAGEFTPAMEGRVDIAKYGNGCYVMENFIPLVQGPAARRPGTRFVSEVKNSANRVWLARFEFNYQQAFILEFGPLYIRFYYDHGLVLSGGVPYEVTTPYTADDLTTAEGVFGLSMVQSGDVIYICHRNHAPRKLSRFGNTNWTLTTAAFSRGPFEDNNTDESLTVTVTDTQQFIGTAFTPYTVNLEASSAVFDANMVGTELEFNITDDSTIKPWAQLKATTLNSICRNDGKYYGASSVTGDTKTGYVSPVHTRGGQADGDNVTWWYLADDQGIIRIDSVTDSTHATGTVTRQVANVGQGSSVIASLTIPAGVNAVLDSASNMNLVNTLGVTPPDNIGHPATLSNNDPITITATGITINYATASTVSATTWAWSKAAWRADVGYPEFVTFFRERLVFARDQKVWFSVAGDFENFAAKEFGEVVADSALTIDIQSDDAAKITYLVPTAIGLVVGTTAGEMLINESSTGEPFGPTNAKVSQSSGYGARPVKPIRVDDSVLFVQRAGRKIRESRYQIEIDNFAASDATVLSDHITKSGIVDMCFHREPYSVAWMVRADGQLVGFTYNKEQDVLGWHRHLLGGDGIVEAVQVIPSPDGARDDLWLVVRRTIDGQTKRYIEYLDKCYEIGDDQDSCYYVDCGATYDGAATTTISGLDWLEGCTVDVLADGASHPQCVVTSGAITLQRSASVVQVGLPYTPKLQTMRIEAGGNGGTSQGQTKRIKSVTIRFLNTLNAKVGADFTTMDRLQFRSGSNPMDSAPPLFTGDKSVSYPNGYETDARIAILQDQPYPMTVCAIIPELTTY